MIEIQGIEKIYTMGETQVAALRGVDLRIEAGEFVALMGPSGSGKSTLAHILGLLDVPSKGSYRLHGREVSGLSEDELAAFRRDEIGFVFQQFNLLPRMNATQNAALPLLYSRHPESGDRPRKLLERVGLGKRGHHRPNELSGGQQQRVAIARALVNQPRIILADEPTGNLDSASEDEILGILKELNDQGMTVIIVTHEESIGRQAKRLIRLRDGVIQSDERQVPTRTRDAAEIVPVPRPLVPPSASLLREIFEHFRQGIHTLTANKIRTALSMLGILIGVAAVVAMLALGRGAQDAIEKQLTSLGSNLLVLRAGATRVGGVYQEAGSSTRLTPDDADALRREVANAQYVSPSLDGRAQITFENKNWNTQVLATTEYYPYMHSAVPQLGRFFTPDENRQRARVAVLGTTLVRELFGGRSPIGESVKINKIPFLIVGVFPQKGSGGFRDENDTVVIPLTTAMYRLLGKTYVDSIEVQIAESNQVADAQDQILSIMRKRKRISPTAGDEVFRLMNLADIQKALTESSRTMSTLLAAIAAISLLVGGIGIMNIMLVSVTERTKEIGLRKAIGATRRDILLQFLAESIVVSAAGGIAGIILGWLVTFTLSQLAGWSTSVSPGSVVMAFSFSAAVGVIFGSYPAKKASMLHPIQALRYE